MIKKGDIVLHIPSGLYYRCENNKHEKWMSKNVFYVKVEDISIIPAGYFTKN